MVLNPLSRAHDNRSWILLIALLGAGWIVLLGIKSNVRLGDEPTHYMLASTIYETKGRPLYYSHIHVSPETRGKPVGSEVLWHSLLASLWWLWGGKSMVIAQFYQAGWYILLVLATYLLGKTLYDENVGLYSGLLVATMPTVASYSILLYTDIPLVALCMLCFLLTIQKKYFWAGLTMGFMILMKRNAYLMTPALLFCLFYSQRDTISFKKPGGFHPLCFLKEGGAKGLLVFITPALLVNIPDIYFRHMYLDSTLFTSNKLHGLYESVPTTFIHPESFIYYPANLIKYPGMIVYACLGLYILRKRYCNQDAVPGVAILSYCILFPLGIFVAYFLVTFLELIPCEMHENDALYQRLHGAITSSINSTLINIHNIFYANFSIRYLVPILPMVAILASKGLVTVKRKWFVNIIFALCILQMLISTLYVYQARKPSPLLIEAYNYIRLNTPPESSFLSPYADLSLYTNRTIMWNSDNTMPDLTYLFWNANSTEAMNILTRYKITHIFIPKSMLWDDSQVKNIGMYPKSFIEKISSFSFLERVFNNEDVSIWAVRPPLVKKE